MGDDIAEAAAWSRRSVGEGAPDGGFYVCLQYEVEVLHGRGGVVCCGGAVDVFFVDDGDPSSVFVDAVPVCDLVSIGCCRSDVGSGLRGEPGLGEEDNIRSEAGDEVPCLDGMFAE